MNLDLATVRKVAGLARLEFTEAELQRLAADLGTILNHVGQLGQLETEGVEPLAHPGNLTDVLREDTLLPSLPRDQALQNAPSHDGECFLVPAVFESTE